MQFADLQSKDVFIQCNFLLLRDVNEWTHNERCDFMIPYLNISNKSTRSHPSKRENEWP